MSESRTKDRPTCRGWARWSVQSEQTITRCPGLRINSRPRTLTPRLSFSLPFVPGSVRLGLELQPNILSLSQS